MDTLPRRLGERPGLGFALSGGAFALLFVLVRPVDELAPLFVGGRTALLAPLLIAATSLSAFVVGSLLWGRFAEGSASRWRPALLGALVGTLSMPVTMYALTVGRYAFVGLPEDLVVGAPPPGATQWVPLRALLLQDVWIALYASLFGFVLTAGLTVVVGAATGEALRRFAERTRGAP